MRRSSHRPSATCREEIHRWLGNLCRVNGQPFRLCPFPARIDSHLFTNASETGAGAVISVKGPDAAGGRLMPLSMPHDELVQRARRGIEFATAFPPLGRDVRYIRRELWGVLAFIMSAAAAPSSRDTCRVVMENLGCVFITGGAHVWRGRQEVRSACLLRAAR